MTSTFGIFPAAGRATRLAGLPGSKEILPVGPQGRPVGRCLLDSYAAASLDRTYVVLREGKSDIADLLGDGASIGVPLEYLTVPSTPAVPYTVSAALAEAPDARWVLGFPDILFRPRDAVAALLERLDELDLDVVLGLFPSDNPTKADMVRLGDDGQIVAIDIKPPRTSLRFTWILAAWNPSFSRYLEDSLERIGPDPPPALRAAGELQMSTLFLAARRDGLRLGSVRFEEGTYLDIGTPDDLERARSDPALWTD